DMNYHIGYEFNIQLKVAAQADLPHKRMNSQFGNEKLWRSGLIMNNGNAQNAQNAGNAGNAGNNGAQPPNTTTISVDVQLYNNLVEGRVLHSEEEDIENIPLQDNGSMESGFAFP
ncbi:36299_t:CDS:2, partial [Gigaspora margarita]